jgi:endogenous inhibitor of DNA gyrase (YacG/DUF329 family)
MECPKCGVDRDTEHGLKIHYGKAHEGSIAGTEVECHNCGSAFRVEPNRAEQEDVRLFCSQECRAETYSNKVELTCEECGKEFERVHSRVKGVERHYCSTECKGDAYNKRVTVECANCGDSFEKVRAEAMRNDKNYCGNECKYEHERGAAHPSYQGTEGIDTALRRDIGGQRWKALRRELHDENELICEWCGDGPFEDTRKIDLHHIIPLMAGGTNTEELLMFLCVGCHRRAEAYTREILDYPIADMVTTERERTKNDHG